MQYKDATAVIYDCYTIYNNYYKSPRKYITMAYNKGGK